MGDFARTRGEPYSFLASSSRLINGIDIPYHIRPVGTVSEHGANPAGDRKCREQGMNKVQEREPVVTPFSIDTLDKDALSSRRSAGLPDPHGGAWVASEWSLPQGARTAAVPGC